MIADDLSVATALADLYAAHVRDPDFTEILQRVPITDDSEMADLIDADGRLRLQLRRPVTLDRYIGAVPDLSERLDALDAAIDMTLRSMARSGYADEGSIDALIAEHPPLESSIREAAALNNAVWSTHRLKSHLAEYAVKPLPCDFGPTTEDGTCRYELRQLLGEGAFGQVYLAIDRQLSERGFSALVSIKVLPGTERTPWARQRLVGEATKARRIDHPNVIRVLDRGVSADNEDFIVHEFVEGGDLGKFVRRGRHLDAHSAVALVAEIARGVHAAHLAGLVHCDLKPNNIVLTADGEPKVADFGIAIRTDELGAALPVVSSSGEPLGNLAFMSPQQFRSEPGALTIPSDIYALGGILFWLLTGELPNGPTPEAIKRTHDAEHGRHEPPRILSARSASMRDLEAICRRAMANRPEERHSSAAHFADDLDAWIRHEPIGWTKPSTLRRITLWARRKPPLALAALLCVLVVGTGIIAIRANARATLKERARVQALAIMSSLMDKVGAAVESGLWHDVLPAVWYFEWMYGPTMLDDEDMVLVTREKREDVVKQLLADAAASGRDGEVVPMTWASALAFWYIRESRYDEAAPLLAKNIARWRALLPAGDGWLADLGVLETCLHVGQLQPAGGSPETLLDLEASLIAAERRLEGEHPGSPFHRVVLDHLMILYGPAALDRPRRIAEIEKIIEEF